MYLQIEPIHANEIIGTLRARADRCAEKVKEAQAASDLFGLHESLGYLKEAMDQVQWFQDAVTLSQVDEIMELSKVG